MRQNICLNVQSLLTAGSYVMKEIIYSKKNGTEQSHNQIKDKLYSNSIINLLLNVCDILTIFLGSVPWSAIQNTHTLPFTLKPTENPNTHLSRGSLGQGAYRQKSSGGWLRLWGGYSGVSENWWVKLEPGMCCLESSNQEPRHWPHFKYNDDILLNNY